MSCSGSEQPLTLLQFVLYLYHHCAEMRPVLMSAEVLTVLAGTLFPYRVGTESSPSTPLDDTVSTEQPLHATRRHGQYRSAPPRH